MLGPLQYNQVGFEVKLAIIMQ